MSTYSIRGILTGTAEVPIFRLVEGSDDARSTTIGVFSWLLDGPRRLLVDTGLLSAPLPGNESKFILPDPTGDGSVVEAAGIDPESIDGLIFTHLHHDHAEAAAVFTRAQYFVPATGWIAAITPRDEHFANTGRWPRDALAHMVGRGYDRLRLLSDRDQPFPGISTERVGGHTTCSQIVRVNTKVGTVALVGDIAYLYQNLADERPVTLYENREAAIAALKRARYSGDIVLPGHDLEILTRFPGGIVVK